MNTMSNLWKLIAVAIGAVLVACQWTPPHSSALEEARRALKLARHDPLVAQAAPDELRDAQAALRRAERSWIETRDDAMTSHLAYIAFQRVVLARNAGLQREAEQRLQRARLEGQNLLAVESAREGQTEAGAHALPVTLVPPTAVEQVRAQSSATATPPAALAPSRSVAEEAKPALQRPAVPPARATRTAPASLAPGKPSLPTQVQARAAVPKRIVGARHERKTNGMQGTHRVAQRAAPRKAASAVGQAAEPARRVAIARPEVWYLEAQGRPSLAALPVARAAAKTASAAEVESRHLRQRRRMQALYAGGHGQPE